MSRKRLIAGLIAVTLVVGPGALVAPAGAEPIDTWPMFHDFDCVEELFNPIDPDTGTRDPGGDPEPGTAEWEERDHQRMECTKQRDHDRRGHRVHDLTNAARYGTDFYREPVRFDGERFRYDYMTRLDIPDVPSAEIFRPCTADTCDIPEELEAHEAPFPVVVVFHGFIATKEHHRFNGQTFAEAGYMAIVVNGTHTVGQAPNIQRQENGADVLDWLHAQEHPITQEADLDRVAFAGHSQGSGVALSYQNDERVHTILAWDGGDSISPDNDDTPIMYQRTDGAFSAPQTSGRSDYPTGRDRGLATYEAHTDRGLDVMHLTFRATSHVDWNGYGVGLAGNRLAELVINYYNLAWLDRHVMGKLVLDGDGNVVTSDGRTEAEERAFRQAIAEDAFERLIAQRFGEGTIDHHNVSMGFFDPVQLATSGDPVYGGNVPYEIEGTWTTDRLATDYYSYCSVSVPDYVGGGEDPVRTADSGDATDGADMRIHGCPEGGP